MAGRELRLLALLSRLLVGAILVPPRLGAPSLLRLVGLMLRCLPRLLRRLVFLRLRLCLRFRPWLRLCPCLLRVLSGLPPAAPITWCRLSSWRPWRGSRYTFRSSPSSAAEVGAVLVIWTVDGEEGRFRVAEAVTRKPLLRDYLRLSEAEHRELRLRMGKSLCPVYPVVYTYEYV